MLLFGIPIVAGKAVAAEGSAPEGYGAAMRWYERAAQEGDAEAQYLLALKYERGVGVAVDLVQAANWFQRAAAQGHAEAQFKLATMYARGIGVDADPTIAASWFEKSALQGLVVGQYNYAVALLNGTGVARDVPLALAWLEIAAASGLSEAVSLRDRVLQSVSAEIAGIARLREQELRKKHAH